MKLADALIRLPESDPHGRMVFLAVRDGLWPFRGKEMYSYVEYDIDTHEYIVTVAVVLVGGYTISFSSTHNAWDMDTQYDLEVLKACAKFRHDFRFNTAVRHVPSNIILGES